MNKEPSKRLAEKRENWVKVFEFMRHLPAEHRTAFSDALKRVMLDETEDVMSDLARSDLSVVRAGRVQLERDTYHRIIIKMMDATTGTGAELKILPIILELQRFQKEMDAPEPTLEEIETKNRKDLAYLLGH
jgi:hypothetical protein